MATFTSTASVSTIWLLTWQIENALTRTTNITEESLAKIVRPGIKEHWIDQVYIYAFDSSNLCRAQLILEIDWKQFNLISQATVIIDSKYRNNVAPEINSVINLFNEFVSEYNLTTKYAYSLPSWADTPERCATLGLVDAEPIRWAKSQEKNFTIPEMPYLRVGLRLDGDT